VIAGVSLSVLVLAASTLRRQPADSAVGVRHLLGARAAVRRGSRFVARYLFLYKGANGKPVARVAI